MIELAQRRHTLNAVIFMSVLICAAHAFALDIEWVTVGDPGNASDVLPDNASDVDIENNYTYGGVDYVYRISKYEVTNAQYAEFLTSVAPIDDPYSLFDFNMLIEQEGLGTQQSPFVYTPVDPEVANYPVQHVDYWDAARFANWLSNGQSSDDTETGAYLLDGTTGITTEIPMRETSASVFLPSEDEWYKAAYYDPTLNDGAGGYWDFATQSNAQPTAEPPPGGSNSANYNDFENTDGDPDRSGHAVGAPYYVSDVGAYSESSSYYGTFDQNGNVWEWVEDSPTDVYWATLRGNSWKGGPMDMNSSLIDNYIHFETDGGNPGPSIAANTVGFRVASHVGDFNFDGKFTVADLDEIVLGEPTYDVTGDGITDRSDLQTMVIDVIGTWFGDSDGDGLFGTSDFVHVFMLGKYETGELAVWSEGDWNLDGLFNSGDIVDAFSDGGYEQGVRGEIPPVPEPSSLSLLVLGLGAVLKLGRRKQSA